MQNNTKGENTNGHVMSTSDVISDLQYSLMTTVVSIRDMPILLALEVLVSLGDYKMN